MQGLRAGRARGLPVPARPASASEGSRGLLAAANRALRTLVRERVQALEAEPDEAFALGPGAELLWRGAPVARLTAGDSRARAAGGRARDGAARPAAARARPPPARGLARRRTCAPALAPLFALREKAPSGAVRGLAFVLGEGLGAVARRPVAAQVAALSARRAARAVAARRHGRPLRAVPARAAEPRRDAPARPALRRAPRPAGRRRARRRAVRARTTSRARSAFYLACGYLPLGPARGAARPPRARGGARLAALAHRPVRARRASCPAILGCPAAELPAVLSAMGYVERTAGSNGAARARAGERVAARRLRTSRAGLAWPASLAMARLPVNDARRGGGLAERLLLPFEPLDDAARRRAVERGPARAAGALLLRAAAARGRAASCSPSAALDGPARIDELEFLLERPIEAVVAPAERVSALLRRHRGGEILLEQASEGLRLQLRRRRRDRGRRRAGRCPPRARSCASSTR